MRDFAARMAVWYEGSWEHVHSQPSNSSQVLREPRVLCLPCKVLPCPALSSSALHPRLQLHLGPAMPAGDHALSHQDFALALCLGHRLVIPMDSSSLPKTFFQPASAHTPHSPFRHPPCPWFIFLPVLSTSDILVNLQGHQSLPILNVSPL